jgi:hypothetical protein
MSFLPMTAQDFNSPMLQAAWLRYKAAIENIRARITANPNMDPAAKSYMEALIESHEDKIACLERSQRIINTTEMIAGRLDEARSAEAWQM